MNKFLVGATYVLKIPLLRGGFLLCLNSGETGWSVFILFIFIFFPPRPAELTTPQEGNLSSVQTNLYTVPPPKEDSLFYPHQQPQMQGIEQNIPKPTIPFCDIFPLGGIIPILGFASITL